MANLPVIEYLRDLWDWAKISLGRAAISNLDLFQDLNLMKALPMKGTFCVKASLVQL